jgi:hypothetical protein
VQNLRIEPSAGGDDRSVGAEASPAVCGDDPISRNEPTDPEGEPAHVAVAPATDTEDAGPQPEPACLWSGDRMPGESAQDRGAARQAAADPAVPPARSAPGEDSLTAAPKRPSQAGPRQNSRGDEHKVLEGASQRHGIRV